MTRRCHLPSSRGEAYNDGVRIFLAGASGVIGQRLIPRLVQAGHAFKIGTRHLALKGNVRYCSFADIELCVTSVCFALKSGHSRSLRHWLLAFETDLNTCGAFNRFACLHCSRRGPHEAPNGNIGNRAISRIQDRANASVGELVCGGFPHARRSTLPYAISSPHFGTEQGSRRGRS